MHYNTASIRDVVDSRHRAVEFDISDVAGGSVSLGYCIPGSYVPLVALEITEEFDGGVQITIGDASAQGRLMTIAQNDPGHVDCYKSDPDYQYETQTELFVFFPSGNPTQGTGKVIVYFQ